MNTHRQFQSKRRRLMSPIAAALLGGAVSCGRVLGLHELEFTDAEGERGAPDNSPDGSIGGERAASSGSAAGALGGNAGAVEVLDGGAAGALDSNGGSSDSEVDTEAPDCAQARLLSCIDRLPCSEQSCGGHPWNDGEIPYRFGNDGHDALRARVLQLAAAWSNPAARFSRCPADDCSGHDRWLEIEIGPEIAAVSLTPSSPIGQQTLWLPLSVSDERIAHELGHVLGLPDIWNRPDRDRYLTLSESAFCGEAVHGSLGVCAAAPFNGWSQPARSSTGYFGPFDASSAMNLAGPEVCEAVDPGPTRALPTTGDISAVIELYRTPSGWTPFAPLAREVDEASPLDYTLADGVVVAGNPALSSPVHPQVQVYVLGSDGQIYTKFQHYSSVEGVSEHWQDWSPLGCCFDTDPAAVSWSTNHTDLFAVSVTGLVQWRTQSLSGDELVWDDWKDLAPLAAGVASAPVVTSRRGGSLDLFVRGGDDYLYWTTLENGVWSAWAKLGDATIASKPAAASLADGRLEVVAVGHDGKLRQLTFDRAWPAGYTRLDGEIASDTAPALVASAKALHLFVHAPETHHLLERVLDKGAWGPWRDLGGIIAGSPAAVGNLTRRDIDLAALVPDGDRHGIWLRSWPVPRPCFSFCSECPEPCEVCQVLAPPLGNPSFHVDAAGNDAWTFRTNDQHLYRITGSESPVILDLSATSTIGSGVPLLSSDPHAYVPSDGFETIIFSGIDADIHRVYREDGSWLASSLSELARAPASAGGAVPYLRSDGIDSIVFRASDQSIQEIYRWQEGWYVANLSKFTQARAATGDPKPFIRADWTNTIIFRTVDNELHEIYLRDGIWWTSNLSLAPGAVASAGDGYGYIRSDYLDAVVHRGTDSAIYELLLSRHAHDTSASNLTAIAGTPEARGDPRGYLRADGVDAVVYTAVDGHIYELARDEAVWVGKDISDTSPSAAGDPIPYVRTDGTSAVAYLGTDQRLHELMLQEGVWGRRTLYEMP